MKILINTPDTNILGGVANHFKGLKPYWSEHVHYNYIAGRKGIPGPILLPFDLIVFFFKLLFGNYGVVLLNPSLGKTALKRDALFLKIASWFNVKKVVFFHGWKEDLAFEITENTAWFLKNYIKADAFLVLADAFKKQMQGWGISKPIYLTTTKVDDSLIDGFIVDKKQFNNTLLFLARIEPYKGALIALNAFEKLKERYPALKFLVVGDGSELPIMKKVVSDREIKDVQFLGSLSGKHLVNAFKNSDIYMLPTDGEGMPTTVLEAMAFGLPVVTRPVGGLNDFFKEESMGALVESKNAKDFAAAIEKFLVNEECLRKTSTYNHSYAKQHFMASKVAKNLEVIFHNV